MEVRRIVPTDLDSFLSLWQSVFDEGDFFASPPPPKERIKSVLKKSEREQFPQYVAIIDDIIVGAAEALPCRDSEYVGYIGTQVHRLFRGQGIAQELLSRVIEDSRHFGYKELKLEVYDFNSPARNLYENFGFSVDGSGAQDTLPTGREVTIVKMSLSIPK
ncbi:FR47-like protein [Vibrio sp. B1FLJ16]|uniref:GNAT family N-acetyltransferase n=1 Tax=Vibrio sp. B1FLJ16 TaxID=2751178 RepID=UPI001AF0975B|nr:GNAT family N-acetyltransferase [Vibrio sp. B1FLJ16]CAD7817912.1 FR47-like protein [Vibrio sp. B1FLJ16]CAE6932667.1 FR47-like protein [Vibrio sp. B1FLJ16]